jgi:hypothetical protein
MMKTICKQITSTTSVSAMVPELLSPLVLVAVGCLSSSVFLFFGAEAEEPSEKDPNLIYSNDFEDAEEGRVPGNYFVIDGDFEIEKAEEEGAGKVLKLLPSPLVEGSIQFGSSIEGGGSVKVRVKAEKRGRSYPRFGVGMHGMKGYRLRVAPAAKQLELVKDQEVIQSVPIQWQSGVWFFVELEVLENNDSWTVSGRAWPENEKRPEDAQIDYISVETGFRGKASITGTPYTQLPIWFDDLEIRKASADAKAE